MQKGCSQPGKAKEALWKKDRITIRLLLQLKHCIWCIVWNQLRMHLSRHFLTQPHDASFAILCPTRVDNSVNLGHFFGTEEKTTTFLPDLELAAASPFHPYKTQRESEKWMERSKGCGNLFEKNLKWLTMSKSSKMSRMLKHDEDMLCAVTIGPWTFDNCLISIASDTEWWSEVHVLRNGPGWAWKLPHLAENGRAASSHAPTVSGKPKREEQGMQKRHNGCIKETTHLGMRKEKCQEKALHGWFINSGLDQFRSGTPAKNSLNVVWTYGICMKYTCNCSLVLQQGEMR